MVYSFRIRAVNAGGNGAPSDEVTATPIDQDVVQADKARSQALAATSRTLLGMATDVLGSRSRRRSSRGPGRFWQHLGRAGNGRLWRICWASTAASYPLP